MKMLYLLVILTQNAAGDINASFVNTESAEECQHKISLIEGVFTASKVPVIEKQCLRSEMQFSEFGHASSSNMIRHFYLIEFNKERVVIDRVNDWQGCVKLSKFESNRRRYCVSSVQQRLS